jgi:hypothetical protein
MEQPVVKENPQPTALPPPVFVPFESSIDEPQLS